MHLPTKLRNAIDEEIGRSNFDSLARAAAELSARYRQQQPSASRFIITDADRLAYVATRMPATYATVKVVLAEIQRLVSDFRVESLLDLGAGTGAASWAAIETFDQLHRITLIEQDGRLIELGRKLAQASDNQSFRSSDWQLANLKTRPEFGRHDLIICSYTLGEIEAAAVNQILKAAWQAAQKALVIIEPGTMKGFSTVISVRNQLLEAGAFIIAPCPHQQSCPMTEGNWCHFAARIDRSALHRRLKGGTLGYEDEKFSYIAAAKFPVNHAAARVLRHPLRHSGFTKLQLCTAEGLQTVTIAKRDKEVWRRARKTDWGGEWGDVSANEPE